jgi:chemotaxis signal transduction protein
MSQRLYKSGVSDDQLELAFRRKYITVTEPRQDVEVMMVAAGNQPVALLMSQVYNIVRPGPDGINVIEQPDSGNADAYGLIEYRGNTLRVIELPRLLRLPLVEPINRSRVLVCGGVSGEGGQPEQAYGVAVEDVLAVKNYRISDLRRLPSWIAPDLKGILLGAILVERHLLSGDNLGQFELLIQPLNFERPDQNTFPEGSNVEGYRPVIVLNLEPVQNILFGG